MGPNKFLAVGLLALTAAARGQDQDRVDPQKALERLESSKSESIPPEVRAAIINKPRIAEAKEERLQGLREAGNPHIQKGTGLFLPDMKDNPAISRVDIAKLHEERVALYERRGAGSGPAAAPGQATGGLAAAGAPYPTTAQAGWNYAGLFFAAASLLLASSAGLYVWRQRQM